MSPIKSTITEFERVLDETPKKLFDYSEDEAAKKPAPDKWSKKEILGHLVDSAANNHQRFVRMQLENNLQLPGYDTDNWVLVQQYNTVAWDELIRLWEAYNLHLLHVFWKINPDKLSNTATIAAGNPMTLKFIVEDYVTHLKHHLDEIIKD